MIIKIIVFKSLKLILRHLYQRESLFEEKSRELLILDLSLKNYRTYLHSLIRKLYFYIETQD